MALFDTSGGDADSKLMFDFSKAEELAVCLRLLLKRRNEEDVCWIEKTQSESGYGFVAYIRITLIRCMDLKR